MSSEAILKNGKDGRLLFGECCTYARPEQLLMLNKGTSFVECDSCGGCPVESLGWMRDGNTGLPVNPIITTLVAGTFTLGSVNLTLNGGQFFLVVEIHAIAGNSTITAIAITGDTVTPAPTVPIDISLSGGYQLAAILDVSVLGSKSVQIDITTDCGTVSFVQPYVVIP